MSRYNYHAETNAAWPRAHAICDRCGRRTNHYRLQWQYDWRGPTIQNLRVLVCESCVDKMQQNGQRTYILPADPVPIMNARPEFFVPDDNPLSGIGADPSPARWQYGSIIGTMTEGGGPQAPFDGNPAKPLFMSAITTNSNSSFVNYVGINWSGRATVVTPSSIGAPVLTHTVTSYTIKAPVNSVFGSTAYLVQGSISGSSVTATWTTLSSGSPAGTVGETITNNVNITGPYQFHRVAFNGTGGVVAVAMVQFNVAETSSMSGGV